jgi:predicted AlkP superfamily pyrophosphatase or phosphodiesterase
MLNSQSVKTVNSSVFSKHFTKPTYSNYSFANIPGTILNLLGVNSTKKLPTNTIKQNRAEKIVFLFMDSFGWVFWEKHYKNYPFLSRFLKEGIVSKLTSQFPSTTAAHVTTIHTTEDVGQSGIHEWFYYEPYVDAIIAPLLFSFAGKKERDTLLPTGINPKQIYPKNTIYKMLKKHKIDSYIFQYKDYTPSPYSDIVFEGATKTIPYRSLADGLTALTRTINSTSGPTYYFYYYDLIDTAGHVNGPDSPTHNAEIHNLFTQLEDLFYQQIKNKKNVTILLSADHGMANINPKNTIYLNKEVPEIKELIQTNKNGELLAPAGACRDMFLYIKENKLIKAKEILIKHLKGKAEVYTTQEMLEKGFFGNNVTNQLLNRLANLIILPYMNESVWWYEKAKFEVNYFGHHGGLTKEEMEVPFLVI